MRVARLLVALFAALVVALGTVRAGTSYLFCIPMQRVVSSSCCAHAEGADAPPPSDGPRVDQPCCEKQVVPVASNGVPADDAPSAAAKDAVTVVALGPVVPSFSRALRVEQAARAPKVAFVDARAGPDVPLRLKHCVFLL